MKPLGIKVKVALAASVTSVVTIALVTAMQIERMKADFTRVLFAQQTALIDRTAQEIDDKLGMLVDVLALTAKHQPPELMSQPAALQAFYANSAALALFDDLLLVNPKGEIIADAPAVPNRRGISTADRAYFQDVMRTGKPVIGDPVLGKTSHQPVVQVAVPLFNQQGQISAILLGVLQLYKDNVLGHLRTARVGRTGYYFALTRDPVPLYVLYPDPARLLQPRPPNANPATTRALRDNFEGAALGTTLQGVPALFSYKRLKSVDWELAATLPLAEAFEPFDGVLTRLAVWGVLASLLAALVVGWVTVRLLSPLVQLRNAIKALRADASQFTPIPLAKRDEIGELTLAFNNLMHERLAADARLQSLVEFAPNAMVVVDIEGRIETFNRQAERYFGYRRDEVAGHPFDMLTPLRYRRSEAGRPLDWFDAQLGAEPQVLGGGMDLRGLRKDGGEFPIEVSLSAVKTDQGTKVLWVISDITERNRLQAEVEARAVELEEERDRAEAANRAKSEFVANMSHEIRTPMNAVLGMVYLLGNTALTTEQRKYLTMVRVSGQSLLGILNDVLDFSKIEARKMELAPAGFDLDDVMNTLATTMTMNAGDKELELAIAVEPDVPRQLIGDALRLQQVLVNLAGNAIKFTQTGEVVVSVRLDRRDAGQALLRFEVRDTGIGMTAAQQAQLFTAFSQGDQSITRRFGGTGLGLAISKPLVRLMGGELGLVSAEGAGSKFWFSLPFGVLPEQKESRRVPALGQLRLLVADDNQTSRRLIGKLIQAWGWEVDEVDSGRAAVELYRRRLAGQAPYDVVLADWHMPDMDGLATAKAIRSAAEGQKQPIVVMVNAFARDRLEEISSAAEADVVLMKPITASNLFDALHQALMTTGGADDTLLADDSIAGRLRGLHFLLVEDNLLNQAVARGILEHAGATLDVVGDGQQAVDRLRGAATRYDIVLMDMQMPVLDGFSATRILRTELRLTLPVIAMTAGVLASERDRCVAAGISDFIAKPVVVEEMMAVIDRHVPKVPRSMLSKPAALAIPAEAAAPATATAAAPVDGTVFSMAKLEKVMGRDAKGRDMLRRLVQEAVNNGMTPIRQAQMALQEGRAGDAARLFHGLRGSVGVMGTQRLIDAALTFEKAVADQAPDTLPPLLQRVADELGLVLQQASAWLSQSAEV
jgi:PAS domain S-box-containing protein